MSTYISERATGEGTRKLSGSSNVLNITAMGEKERERETAYHKIIKKVNITSQI